MRKDHVILVDRSDNQIATKEKLEAHLNALLHRAVSVFIFNTRGEWLLQQRAKDKYHSRGLWSNTCCTHPYPGERNSDAAYRRLMEEMGIQCELTEIFDFIYKEALDNELTEHEFDHVFVGITDQLPETNPCEVMNYKYIDYNDLINDIIHNSDDYTVWFRKIIERVNKHIEGNNIL